MLFVNMHAHSVYVKGTYKEEKKNMLPLKYKTTKIKGAYSGSEI